MSGASKQTVVAVQAILASDGCVTPEQHGAILAILNGASPGVQTPDEMMDEKSVGVVLKCSHQTLWRLEKRGELVPARLGRSRRYSRRQVVQFVDEALRRAEARRVRPRTGDSVVESDTPSEAERGGAARQLVRLPA